MELTVDEILQKHAKCCFYCMQNTLLPYGYEWTCFLGGYNVIKNELTKLQRKKNRLHQSSKKWTT